RDAARWLLLMGHQRDMALHPPFQHPGRLVLLCGDEADGVFRQPLGGLVGLDKRLKPISILIDVDTPDAVDRLLYGWHSILRSRFQGPRWINPKFEKSLTKRT